MMKKFILIIPLAVSFAGITSCMKEGFNGKVLINFINKTGATIEHATADNIELGDIAHNGQTGFVSFEKFGIDTQMPDCNFTGLQNNDTLKSTSVFYWCGTEKSQLKPGKYNIEITLYKNGANKYFDLNFR